MRRIPERLRLAIAKDTRRHLTNDAGDEMRVSLQRGVVEKTVLTQIDLHAVQNGVHPGLGNSKLFADERMQSTRHRMRRLTCEQASDLGAPPGKRRFGGCGVADFIDHVVYLAAIRIDGADRAAAS